MEEKGPTLDYWLTLTTMVRVPFVVKIFFEPRFLKLRKILRGMETLWVLFWVTSWDSCTKNTPNSGQWLPRSWDTSGSVRRPFKRFHREGCYVMPSRIPCLVPPPSVLDFRDVQCKCRSINVNVYLLRGILLTTVKEHMYTTFYTLHSHIC